MCVFYLLCWRRGPLPCYFSSPKLIVARLIVAGFPRATCTPTPTWRPPPEWCRFSRTKSLISPRRRQLLPTLSTPPSTSRRRSLDSTQTASTPTRTRAQQVIVMNFLYVCMCVSTFLLAFLHRSAV